MVVDIIEYRKKKRSKEVWRKVKWGGICASVLSGFTLTCYFLLTNIAMIIENYDWKPALVF